MTKETNLPQTDFEGPQINRKSVIIKLTKIVNILQQITKNGKKNPKLVQSFQNRFLNIQYCIIQLSQLLDQTGRNF